MFTPNNEYAMKVLEVLSTSYSPYELSVLVSSFPRAWKKMLHKLISDANPKLTFLGLPIFGPRGFGPAVLDADASIKKAADDGLITIHVPFFLGAKHPSLYECACDSFELQRVAYSVDDRYNNRLILVYHATISYASLERAFYDAFEDRFGERYDENDVQHVSFFNELTTQAEQEHAQAHFVFAAGINGSVENSSIVTAASTAALGKYSAGSINKYVNDMIDADKFVEL